MSFKLNLKTKIKLDNLLKKLLSTIRDKPGRHWLDKGLVRELLGRAGFKKIHVRDIDLYVRPFEGENMEIVVLGNELAIYRTSVDDIALRKSPYWQEVFSIRNIRKIMNDKDILISKGRKSLEILHSNALELLDLACTGDDLMLLQEDGCSGLERQSIIQIRESLDLFVALLNFQPVSFGGLTHNLHIYAGIKSNGGNTHTFEPIIIFDEKSLYLGMKKGPFKLRMDSDLAWLIKHDMKKEQVDLEGIDVFKFLAELALAKQQVIKKSMGMT
jgi:hypothetical protein